MRIKPVSDLVGIVLIGFSLYMKFLSGTCPIQRSGPCSSVVQPVITSLCIRTAETVVVVCKSSCFHVGMVMDHEDLGKLLVLIHHVNDGVVMLGLHFVPSKPEVLLSYWICPKLNLVVGGTESEKLRYFGSCVPSSGRLSDKVSSPMWVARLPLTSLL